MASREVRVLDTSGGARFIGPLWRCQALSDALEKLERREESRTEAENAPEMEIT